MLVRVQYCLWVLRWLNHVVFGSFHTVWVWSLVQDEFWTASTSVSLWQETIVSKRFSEYRFSADGEKERKDLVSSCERPSSGGYIKVKCAVAVIYCETKKCDSSHSVGCNQFDWVENVWTENLFIASVSHFRISIQYPCDQSINH